MIKGNPVLQADTYDALCQAMLSRRLGWTAKLVPDQLTLDQTVILLELLGWLIAFGLMVRLLLAGGRRLDRWIGLSEGLRWPWKPRTTAA